MARFVGPRDIPLNACAAEKRAMQAAPANDSPFGSSVTWSTFISSAATDVGVHKQRSGVIRWSRLLSDFFGRTLALEQT